MKTKSIITTVATRFAQVSTTRLSLASRLFAAILVLAGTTLTTSAQTYSVTSNWYFAAGAVTANNIITTGDNTRGLAYDVNSNLVFVCAKGGGAPAPTVEVLDGATGNFMGMLNASGTSGGTFVLNQVGVGGDSVIYSANLTTAAGVGASVLKIYRWADTNSATVPTVAYVGLAMTNPAAPSFTANYRVGDTMAVSGSGANTLILMGAANGTTFTTNFVMFTSADGITFTNHILAVSGMTPSGGQIFGMCFYTNNTFLVRQSGGTGNNVLLVQFPANIASLDQGPIACTQLGSYSLPNVLSTTAFISSSGTPGGLFAVASPQNAGGASAAGQVALYIDPVVGAGGCSLQQANTNYPHLTSNGNLAGGVVVDVVHNQIYSMDCNNGVRCSAITTIPPQAPSISAQPVGATAYVPYALNVTAAGFCPLIYQWQATNNTSGFTNIPGATASSYTITTASTNYYRVIITNTINPAVTSSVVLVTGTLPVSNASVTQLWSAAAGSLGFLSPSDNNGRGIAYSTNQDRVVVAVANATAPSLNVMNGTTGASLGTLGIAGLTTGGTFAVDQVGINDDGVVYSCNLGYNAAIIINRWTNATVGFNPSAAPAFNASPGGSAERYGDNMAVRGSGNNTQILIPSSLAPGLGVGTGTNVVLLTTTDGGVTFSATVLAISGVPGGFAGSGIAFDSGNNFWAKAYNGDLFKINFDPIGATGTVVFDYSSSGQVPQSTMGLGVDSSLNLLSTIVQGDIPDDVQMFQLTGSTAPPVLFNQAIMSNNGNANANGAIAMRNGRLYALDVNNGVIALSYGAPVGTAPSIVTPPQSTTAFTNTTANFSVVAAGSLPLNYQWRFNSNNITGANAVSYSITNPTVAKAGYYDVIVYNGSGSVTSAPALLTVLIPVLSPVVTNQWSLAPGSRSYLDSSTYNTRGLAYDPTQSPPPGNLLVADHFNIYVLNAANGADYGTLNMTGVPNVGFSQWLVDQIRVGDDGLVYAANLQDYSFGSAPLSIVSFPSSAPGTTATAYAWGGGTGADPSGAGWRLGDTMAVRGAGNATQLLMGTPDANGVILFTNNGDGTFNAIVITVPAAPTGFASGGVAFGPGNTFWAKGAGGYNLRQVAFDFANPANATVLQSYTAGTQVPNTMTGIGVDVTKNILAGVNFNDTPNDLQLFLISGNSNPPALVNQSFFPQANANNQLNSATDLKSGWGFGLDVNNGITALTYGTPSAPAVTITSIAYAPGNVTINWNNTINSHNYQVQGTSSLTLPVSWSNLGSPVTAVGPTASYTDTSGSLTTKFYRVISQ